jgi:hypothetical protein
MTQKSDNVLLVVPGAVFEGHTKTNFDELHKSTRRILKVEEVVPRIGGTLFPQLVTWEYVAGRKFANRDQGSMTLSGFLLWADTLLSWNKQKCPHCKGTGWVEK